MDRVNALVENGARADGREQHPFPFPLPDRRERQAGINHAFRTIKAQRNAHRTRIDVLADRLTVFASSTPFLVFHAIWFAVWIPWNTGLLGLRRFDPFPFGLLTMIVSLEAIFLSIFVLIAQNREAAIAELREEVTLAVNLRMEAEVTKVLQLVAGLYPRLNLPIGQDDELKEMLRPLDAHELEGELLDDLRAAAEASPRPH